MILVFSTLIVKPIFLALSSRSVVNSCCFLSASSNRAISLAKSRSDSRESIFLLYLDLFDLLIFHDKV